MVISVDIAHLSKNIYKIQKNRYNPKWQKIKANAVRCTVVNVVTLSLVYSGSNTAKWIFFNMNKKCDLHVPEIFRKDSPKR